MNKTLIFTATYNESKNITLLLNYIDELNLDLDILIVDDNSPDRTWEIVKNNPDIYWSYTHLSKNSNITWEIVKNNPDDDYTFSVKGDTVTITGIQKQ